MKQDLPFVLYIASNFWNLILFFLVFLLALDIILVRWLSLSKIAWKRVDYIWLTVAVLGLLSSSADSRRLLSVNQIENQRIFTQEKYKDFRRQVEFGKGIAVCRQFIKTEYSPPDLERSQKEYDNVCEYYRNLDAALPKNASEKPQPIELPSALNRPNTNERILEEDFSRLDNFLLSYNKAQQDYAELESSQKKTDFENTATILGPLLFSFALALRVVKVTGEVKLERLESAKKMNETNLLDS
jgi:hypothetical protein